MLNCECNCKKTIYYAHPMYLYDTPIEQRDIDLLKSLRFDVINPNSEPYISQYQAEIDAGRHNMDYWTRLAASCDAIAFRGNPDGSVLSGVGAEVKHMVSIGKPVIELPCMMPSRFIIDVEETRQYLREVGQR